VSDKANTKLNLEGEGVSDNCEDTPHQTICSTWPESLRNYPVLLANTLNVKLDCIGNKGCPTFWTAHYKSGLMEGGGVTHSHSTVHPRFHDTHCDSKLASYIRPLVCWGAPGISSTVSKLNRNMLIIKASFVAAILSSLLFLEANCVEVKRVEIGQSWSDLHPPAWSTGIRLYNEQGHQEVKHPVSGDPCLLIWHSRYLPTMHVLNQRTESVTYVFRKDSGDQSTEITCIDPDDMHILMATEGSIYIKLQDINQIVSEVSE